MSLTPRLLLTTVCLGLASGCASVRSSDRGGRLMVDVANTGWYLLNLIPLASGDPEAPNECSCRLFQQTTTLANNTRLLDFAATQAGAIGLRNVTTYTSDESVFFILLKRHVIHTSAELILPPEENQTP